jgi:hypothetical protein
MSRVRGFAPWAPRAESRALLEQVRQVMAEYAKHLPLTGRQIFYRLVGAHSYPKTEAAADRLNEMLNRARRARLIPFEHIRDDGIINRTPHHYDDAADLLRTLAAQIDGFRLDRQGGQWVRLIFCIEAAGMVPQVQRIADGYGISVLSSGGFDSTTAKYDLAQIAIAWPAVEILHIGDHDPSGCHLFSALAEDVAAFAGPDHDIRFTRLAVTPEQIRALRLPTAPPKPTDRRSFTGETAQVEAIPPDILATIIRDAIESRVDAFSRRLTLNLEKWFRDDLRAKILPALGGRP